MTRMTVGRGRPRVGQVVRCTCYRTGRNCGIVGRIVAEWADWDVSVDTKHGRVSVPMYRLKLAPWGVAARLRQGVEQPSRRQHRGVPRRELRLGRP